MEHPAAGGSVMLNSIIIVLGIGAWVCQALAWTAIARKFDEDAKAWWAWVPGANILLMLDLAEMGPWWLLAFVFPLAGMAVLVWCGFTISESLGQPPWLGVLFPLYPLSLAAFAYLAWGPEPGESPLADLAAAPPPARARRAQRGGARRW
jgi:hypothetical protein